MRLRSAIGGALTLLIGIAGCGGVDREEADAPTTTTTVAPDPAGRGCDAEADAQYDPAAHERVDVTSDGSDRWYARYVPASYDGSPTALVVDLHGYLSGSAGQASISALDEVADEAGFILVTPQGSSDMPYWNAVPHDELPDDVAFVETIIDDVSADLCIDPARVYVDGFSNGAFLTSLVACRLADRVAAVAAVAGLLLPDGCEPARAVPILAIHGTEDRYVGFAGPPNPALAGLSWNEESRTAFDGLAFADVRDTASRWAALQSCESQPSQHEVSANVERTDYGGCADGSVVQLYVADGAGHTWPSSAAAAASEPILGPATDELDASRLIWSFFEDHPMPSAS